LKYNFENYVLISGSGNPQYQAPYLPATPSSGGLYPNISTPSNYGVSDNLFFILFEIYLFFSF
jgi:hypothetical protein